MANEGTFWVDEEEGVLIIRDTEGEEDNYVIEHQLELDDNTYLILVQEDMVEDENADAFVLKITNDGEEQILSVIEDEDEFQKVRDSYLAMDLD
ncbi:DUF1292 domain-containing protein [Natronospora cellulosivora (SeqCode)]